MSNSYWLFNWLDAHGINDLSMAERALSEHKLVEELREVAVQAKESSPSLMQRETAIVAGRGLDLTGNLECSTNSCRQQQVNELFRKAWHYFDRIIVDDWVAHQVLLHWDITATNPKEALLSHIEVLLYLRKIGAEDLVEFQDKPRPCISHWKEHAVDAGLQSVLDAAETLVPRLATEAKIKVEPHSKGVASFTFNHPSFEVVCFGQIKLGGVRGKPSDRVRRTIVREVIRRYIPHLTSDVIAARASGVPLGSTIWLHRELLTASETITPANIAFNLDLPILHGIPIGTLIKLRNDEYESFQRFRDSLRLAVKERLNTSSSPNVKELSEQICLDIIEPELRRIRDHLAAAEKTIAKKTAIGVFMGALVTTCGIFAGLPIPAAIAAGCGAATTAGTGAVTKYLEEKQSTSLSDMYFLWKAVKHEANKL